MLVAFVEAADARWNVERPPVDIGVDAVAIVLFGEIATTTAVSVAEAAVEDAFTVPVLVPSVSLTEPMVFVPAAITGVLVAIETATVPVTVVEVRETGTVLFGEIATTSAVSVVAAAVEAALMVPRCVPSVSLLCWEPPVRVASRAKPVMAAGGVRVVMVALGRITGTEAAANA